MFQDIHFSNPQENEEGQNILPHRSSRDLKHLHVSGVMAPQLLGQQEIGKFAPENLTYT
jgi:hypothetical protein